MFQKQNAPAGLVTGEGREELSFDHPDDTSLIACPAPGCQPGSVLIEVETPGEPPCRVPVTQQTFRTLKRLAAAGHAGISSAELAGARGEIYTAGIRLALAQQRSGQTRWRLASQVARVWP